MYDTKRSTYKGPGEENIISINQLDRQTGRQKKICFV